MVKAADAKSPKFDGTWWKQNKAKDADPKGLLEGALNDYQKAKIAFEKAPGDPMTLTKKLDVVAKVAKAMKADPKLGVLQKDTKDALANYEKMAGTALTAIGTASKSQDLNFELADLIKRQSKALEAFCKSEFSTENYEFLVLMSTNVKNKKVYDRYVALGSPKQINISSATLGKFEKVAAEGDNAKWDAPGEWKEATGEIFAVMKRDTLPRYKLAMTKKVFGAIKLP